MSPSRKNIINAFRTSIGDQIISFKMKMFNDGNPVSAISGTPLEWRNCHVDHFGIKFVDLVNTFVEINKLDFNSLKITYCFMARTNTHSYILGDSIIRSQWREFHLDNAKLRLLLPKENRSLPNK